MWRLTNRATGWIYSVAVLAWCGGLWAVLQVQYVPMAASHAVCGPWGCGPPLEALVAWHGFWLVGMTLPTYAACRLLSPYHLRTAGWLLFGIGLVGLAGVAVWEATHWWPQASEFQRQYLFQRCVFAAGTLIEVPLVPVTVAGVACLAGARWQRSAPQRDAADPQPASDDSLRNPTM